MVKVNADTLTLKLHVADGKVWQSMGTELPRETGQTVMEFVAAGRHTRADSVRLLGTFGNATLIVQMYGQVQIELVSPLACPTGAARRDPNQSLYYMRKSHLAPSQGGFHVMAAHEQPVYGIAALLAAYRGTNPPASMLLKLARQHPVWKSLQFIPTLHQESAAAILGLILDPRWYIDTLFPDRGAKLNRYLGLEPKTQAGVTFGKAVWRRHEYCQLVRSSWYMHDDADTVMRNSGDRGGLAAVAGSRMRGLAPGDFLWRAWARRFPSMINYPSEAFNRAILTADLRTSQRFIHFLRLVWLSEIYRDSSRVSENGLSLFRAEDFFKDVVEADAYNHYILSG